MGGASQSVSLAAAQATLTIDLDALVANWRFLATLAEGAECAAVVKADAYGTGLEPAVAALSAAGCRTFFVAHASEGARARTVLGASSVSAIYVLNGLTPYPEASACYLASGLRPVLTSLEQARRWADASRGRADAPAAALQIDTGMNRLGVALSEIDAIAGIDGLRLVHVMSHFVSSEERDDPLNSRQVAAFARARNRFPGIAASLCNSSGIFLPHRPFFDLVRPGYALYGGNPTPGKPNPMRPVVSLSAPILQLREIAAGETVGYNGQWTATRPSRLATIGVGYADGLPRNLMATDTRPGGEAIVLGRRCRFAGRVSMDLIVLDVTDVDDPRLAPGTPVELLGENIGVDELGARAGTIGYEVLTSLGRRYCRKYVGG